MSQTFFLEVTTRKNRFGYSILSEDGWRIDQPIEMIANDGYKQCIDNMYDNKLYIDPLNEITHQKWIFWMNRIIEIYELDNHTETNRNNFTLKQWLDM